MRIAKVFIGSPNNRKGQFNNCHERTKRLRDVANVDAYLLRPYDGCCFRLLKWNLSPIIKDEYTILDGVKYKNLWLKLSLTDYILSKKLKLRSSLFLSQLEKYVLLFKEYDLVSAHSIEGSYLAYLINQKFNIPYSASWHGSDINVLPFTNKKYLECVKLVQESSACNFYVSKKLLEVSNSIYKGRNKEILYTGVSSVFSQLSKAEISELKQKFNIKTKYVVGFIGNFVTVKNVLILPELFDAIQKRLVDVTFITIGNGKLEFDFLRKIDKYKIKNFIHLGKLEPEIIPKIMNCLDVLLLPSLNEGLPRVTLEALTCGVNVVGSDRGGIPESIGSSNTFKLDENFVEKASNRAVEIIKNNETPKQVSLQFSWKYALKKEMDIYKNILEDKSKE